MFNWINAKIENITDEFMDALPLHEQDQINKAAETRWGTFKMFFRILRTGRAA